MSGEHHKPILDSVRDSDDLEDLRNPKIGFGRPRSTGGLSPQDVMTRLLGDQSLEIDDGPAGPSVSRKIVENRQGLKKGYDPYESGLLDKKQRNRKRDLRALSAWIAAKKRARPGDE